jgi:hypothetical protein
VAAVGVGWATPVLVDPTRDMTYDLQPLGRGGTVLRVTIATDDEYLLIEYREAAPGDGKIPANGVLMFHVAQSLPIFPPTLQSPYRMSLIEADDDSAMFKTELQGGNAAAGGVLAFSERQSGPGSIRGRRPWMGRLFHSRLRTSPLMRLHTGRGCGFRRWWWLIVAGGERRVHREDRR